MYARTFDVLHDPGDEHVLSVAYGIHFNFLAAHILVYEHRVIYAVGSDYLHVLSDVIVGVGDYHVLPPKYIGGAHKHGIVEGTGGCKGFGGVHDRVPRRAGYAALVQQLVKALPVLCRIYAVRRCAQDIYPHIREKTCQLYGCLPAELHHYAPGLFSLDQVFHILRGQGVKVEPVPCVEVGGYGLRVVVADHSLISHFLERPHAVYGAVVKFYALSYADRAGAEYQHTLLACVVLGYELLRFIFLIKGGVEVGGLCRKFPGAGIHQLVHGTAVNGTFLSAYLLYHLVGIAVGLGIQVFLLCKLPFGKIPFNVCKVGKLCKEPPVDLCYLMYGVN